MELATAGEGSAVVVSQGQSSTAAGTHLFVDLRDPATGAWRTTAALAAGSLVTGSYGPPVAVDAGWAGWCGRRPTSWATGACRAPADRTVSGHERRTQLHRADLPASRQP
ncbi:hypothetical protein FSC37_20975 [Piscinibacter aquaticus]|uniref:Uncharacterized protein n=1 Tax=Piscinibacter aquaticus TaxID=392597 RepID=A0A5C6U664_9BURK|nr:hypothetical protein FSC37_20975 [Piscinibacter aquaticus]